MTPAEDRSPDKEQSMDDILASIRRIMLDEQARLNETGPAETPDRIAAPDALVFPRRAPAQAAEPAPVLILDDSMAVQSATGPSAIVQSAIVQSVSVPEAEDRPDATPVPEGAADAPAAVSQDPSTSEGAKMAEEPAPANAAVSHAVITPMTAQALEEILAPAAAAAAAASVDALLRRLQEERQALLQPASSSVSIEDFVRGELRPLLKSWLDEHLPSMVERLVRAELARLTLRHGG